MQRYSRHIVKKVTRLRSLGKTYGEIRKTLGIEIPKSTLSGWCKQTRLPKNYSDRIMKLNIKNLDKGRLIALETNRIKREELLGTIKKNNIPLVSKIKDKHIAKIALAMLCLGEASKYKSGTRHFYLGSSDPRIIILFIELLKYCFDFDIEKIRCTVQCRADQDTVSLEKYWQGITGIPKRLFYKPLIDPRTKGKPTKNKEYKGVLRVDYFDIKVQLDLENLADLLYNKLAVRARSLNG